MSDEARIGETVVAGGSPDDKGPALGKDGGAAEVSPVKEAVSASEPAPAPSSDVASIPAAGEGVPQGDAPAKPARAGRARKPAGRPSEADGAASADAVDPSSAKPARPARARRSSPRADEAEAPASAAPGGRSAASEEVAATDDGPAVPPASERPAKTARSRRPARGPKPSESDAGASSERPATTAADDAPEQAPQNAETPASSISARPGHAADAPSPARPGRSRALAGKPVEEMGIDELVTHFSRRRRGRPSKRELEVREALAAAKANPTPELVEKARAAVMASLSPAARRAAQGVAEEPAGEPAGIPAAIEGGEAAAPAEPVQQAVDGVRQPAEGAGEGGYGQRRRRHERRDRQQGDRPQDQRADRSGGDRQEQDGSWQKGRDGRGQQGRDRDADRQRQRDGRDRQAQGNRGDRQGQGGVQGGRQFDKNGRRSNGNVRTFAEPKANREELEELKVGDLRAKAAELGLDPAGLKKDALVDAVYAALVKQEGFFEFKGILDPTNEGFGFIRTKNYLASENDIYISASLLRSNGLRRGDEVAGIARLGRPNDKFPAASKILSVNGKSPDELRGRPRFGDLTPVFPSEPLKMEHGRDSILGRCIDLVAPIGKGQRGLIVSPPKAGKTTVLKKIAESIAANNPEVHLICLLVDERPEEVTDMQRSIKGEVVASTFDMPCDNHITVSELVVERAKRLVEQGEDVVILLDSITRLARAYNLAQPASGRILSGGVDSTALYPPKRFLGAARNIEGGGSLTILASALVDTGSKMDEVIFEEFKGTGNMELKLDRDLADRRIFPAIDPIASGTRKEELLLDSSIAPFVWGIRRILAGMNSNERAMSSLIKSLKATANNEEFLVRSAKKAQMQELNGEL